MAIRFQHKVEATPRDGGVHIDIRENFCDMEYADWALLSPEDALELRTQIDSALEVLGVFADDATPEPTRCLMGDAIAKQNEPDRQRPNLVAVG